MYNSLITLLATKVWMNDPNVPAHSSSPASAGSSASTSKMEWPSRVCSWQSIRTSLFCNCKQVLCKYLKRPPVRVCMMCFLFSGTLLHLVFCKPWCSSKGAAAQYMHAKSLLLAYSLSTMTPTTAAFWQHDLRALDSRVGTDEEVVACSPSNPSTTSCCFIAKALNFWVPTISISNTRCSSNHSSKVQCCNNHPAALSHAMNLAKFTLLPCFGNPAIWQM